jgi:DNA-binding IclR family transcriptional regulator
MPKKTDSYYSVPLEKGLRILNLFAQNHAEFSLQEVSKGVGTTPTSAYRFVNTLVQLGYLKKDPRTRLLSLGSKAFIMGNGFLRGFSLIQKVKPLIDEACNQYQVTVDSALYEGGALFILYRREVSDSVTYRLPMMTTELHCSAFGKAVLAFLPRKEQLETVERLSKVRKTDRTLTSVKAILKELRITRQRGYSLNDEEYIPGLIAIGAPITNTGSDRVVGAISFDFSTAQHTLSEIERRYGEAIIKLARAISQVIPVY